MELLEVGRVTIEPFSLERIMEATLTKKVNEHITLSVKGVLKQGEEDRAIQQVGEQTPIRLRKGKQTLFCGILQDVQITCENQVYWMEFCAVSNTILLDVTPKKRSFQEHGMAFEEIAKTVTQETKAAMQFEAPSHSISRFVLQYNETDWEFLKRIASHTNSVLLAKANKEKPEFFFGAPEGMEFQEKLENFNYSIQKNLSFYRTQSQGGNSVSEEDAIFYTVTTDRCVFELGDMLQWKQQSLYVYEATLHLLDSVLVGTYLLSTKQALSIPKYYNSQTAGLFLDGTVLQAKGDTVTVHLAIDETQEESKACPLSYATGYTAEGHTGWYVMPESGDTVRIIFPTEDEDEVYAAQSVRQAASDRTGDPKIKYLRTPDGKEIKLEKEEILITAKDEVTYIRIHEQKGVEIITNQEVNVNSGGNISVNSGANISMTSAGNFSIQAGKNFSLNAGDTVSMTCHENKMTMETGGTGIEMSAQKPVKVNGGTSINVQSGTTMGMDAGASLSMTCQQNKMTMETGGTGIEMSAQKPVKVNGGTTLNITSGSTMGIDAGAALTVSTKANANVSAQTSASLSAGSTMSLSCQGNTIGLESGGAGISMNSGKLITVKGSNAIKVDSGTEFDLKSGTACNITSGTKTDLNAGTDLSLSSKNLKQSASQKLSLTASSSLEQSCLGSSISLDGDINLKAKLIKEN